MLINYLVEKLVLKESYINNVANTSSIRYKKFQIPKLNGSTRTIYQPAQELKTIQRVIHKDILSKLPIHSAATAYSEGSTVKKNAEPHLNMKYLLRLDFKNFFESISKNDVEKFINDNKHYISNSWSNKDTELLSNLVCFKNRLTIGSTSSPMLSNVICYNLDSKIKGICESQNVKYTRYADDMFFSTNTPDILFSISRDIKIIVRSLNYPKSLWINFDKTVHSSFKRKMSITGLILTNNGNISIGRKKKREIKSLVYKWDFLSSDKKKYLTGYLAYCKSVEPNFINSLCNKYGASRICNIQKYN